VLIDWKEVICKQLQGRRSYEYKRSPSSNASSTGSFGGDTGGGNEDDGGNGNAAELVHHRGGSEIGEKDKEGFE
jgi:hypothetical protein